MPISDLNDFSDEKLVQIYKEGNERAFEVLYKRYDRPIRALTHTFFLFGGDDDDLRQEGLFGLLSAVNHYDENKEGASSFKTFAYTCIRARILNAVNGEKTEKRKVGVYSVSIDDFFDDVEKAYLVSPEDTVIGSETIREITAKIRKNLSPFEKKVFDFYLEGLSYIDIAKALDHSPKSVDNALQRIKEKSRKIGL